MGAVEWVKTQARLAWEFARPLEKGGQQLPLPPSIPGGNVVNVPDRGEMFVREAGTGDPPIILLHGWALTADLSWFSGVYEVAAGRGRMLAPDLRGHGRGLRSQDPFTLEAAADDTAALCDELGLGPAVLVGYSMGGSIALQTWRRHPHSVAGLVLVSTALEYRADLWERVTWLGMAGVEYVLRFGAPQGLVDRYLRKAAERSPDLERCAGWLKAEVRRGDPSDIASAGRSTSAFDARDFAGAISVPTAVVVSRRDRLVKEVRQRELADAIAGSHVVELDAAHNAWMAQPREYAEAIDEALGLVIKDVEERAGGRRPARPGPAEGDEQITHL